MAYEIDINKGGGNSFNKFASGMSKLLGGSRGPETAHYKFYELEAAEVVDIILDVQHPEAKKYGGYNAIGMIFYSNISGFTVHPNVVFVGFAVFSYFELNASK